MKAGVFSEILPFLRTKPYHISGEQNRVTIVSVLVSCETLLSIIIAREAVYV